MTEDINLVQVGIETLADVARDRNVDAQSRIQAAALLVQIAQSAAATIAESAKTQDAPNRATRRKAS